jgi:hypothetical protein
MDPSVTASGAIRVALKHWVKTLVLKNPVDTMKLSLDFTRFEILLESFVHGRKVSECCQVEGINNCADWHELDVVSLALRPVNDVPDWFVTKNRLKNCLGWRRAYGGYKAIRAGEGLE